MSSSSETIRQNLSSNIVRLRQSKGMTQAELAEQMSYSDKAISKWERGESIPDVIVLKQLAELFGVTVDWLLEEQNKAPEAEPPHRRRNRLIISFLSALTVWFIATALYVILMLALPGLESLWVIYICAIPASLLVLLVFNCIWGKKLWTYIILSLFVWSVLFMIIVLLGCKYWLILFIGIPSEIIIFLSSALTRGLKKALK